MHKAEKEAILAGLVALPRETGGPRVTVHFVGRIEFE